MNMFGILLLLSAGWAEPAPSVGRIQIESVLVTPIEHVEVSAKEGGELLEVAAREGDLVDEQAILAQIDDADAKLACERAGIELEIARQQSENDVNVRAAKKSLDVARAELKRATDSVERFRRSVSASEIDRLQLTADRAELAVEQAELDQKTAELTRKLKENVYQSAVHQVERRKVLAPISGMIVQVHAKRGEHVQPGAAVCRLLRLDRLRAEGLVSYGDLPADVTGRPVILTVDLPGKPQAQLTGKLVFVSPEVNPVNGLVRVWAEIDNHDLLLRPGLRGALTIELAKDGD
jgi:multidrug efflux pump subunit AcrA (membrane-fusion protein)